MSSLGIPNVGQYFGSLLIGYLLNWCLFGALTVQIYIYYSAFPKDRISTKIFVVFIYCLEIVQTITATHDTWRIFGSKWGDLNELAEVGLVWFSIPLMTVSCCVQLFMAHRIWKLSGNILLVLLVASVSFTQCIAAIVVAIRILLNSDANALYGDWSGVWLGGSALCDNIITVCMFIYLSRIKSVFKSTQGIITRLIRLTIETGLVTAIIALVDVILLTSNRYDYFTTPSLILSKLYSNCVLVLLNSRIRIVGGRSQDYDAHEIDQSPTSDGESLSFNVRTSTMRALQVSNVTSSFGEINVEIRRGIHHDEYPVIDISTGAENRKEDNESTFKAKSLEDIESQPDSDAARNV